MNRITTSFVLMFIVAAGVGLYQLKYKTLRLQKEVSALNASIVRDREAIRVLEAEWTYLTRPERVASLSERYLALRPAEAEQVIASADLVAKRSEEDVRMAQVDDFRASGVVLAKAPSAPRYSPPPTTAPVQVAEPAPRILEVRKKEEPERPLFERIRLVLMEGGHD